MPTLLTPHGSQEIGSFWEQFTEICSLSACSSWGTLTTRLTISSNDPSPDVCCSHRSVFDEKVNMTGQISFPGEMQSCSENWQFCLA